MVNKEHPRKLEAVGDKRTETNEGKTKEGTQMTQMIKADTPARRETKGAKMGLKILLHWSLSFCIWCIWCWARKRFLESSTYCGIDTSKLLLNGHTHKENNTLYTSTLNGKMQNQLESQPIFQTGDWIIRFMHILVFPIKVKPARKRVACRV